MKFDYIKLVDGDYGAWAGSGMKRAAAWYTSNTYGIGTTANATLNEDYYVIWNEWPIFSGSGTTTYTTDETESTDLNDIGLEDLFFATANGSTVSNSLDCAIVRKSDRKAVRIQVSGTTAAAAYTTEIATHANSTIAAIDPSDGPWSPEIGRLVNMGYIG